MVLAKCADARPLSAVIWHDIVASPIPRRRANRPQVLLRAEPRILRGPRVFPGDDDPRFLRVPGDVDADRVEVLAIDRASQMARGIEGRALRC